MVAVEFVILSNIDKYIYNVIIFLIRNKKFKHLVQDQHQSEVINSNQFNFGSRCQEYNMTDFFVIAC